jgi:TRAP-type C4-dicarboxylate transport system permease small subunit
MELRKKIDKVLEYSLVGILAILVLDVLWQVASRYLLSSPSTFTDELAGFLLIWVALLGAAYVTGQKQHLAIELIINKVNARKANILRIIIQVSVIVFTLFVMIVGGIWLIYTRFYLGQVSAALQLPLGYVYMVLPISGVFIIYYSIINSIELINQLKASKKAA